MPPSLHDLIPQEILDYCDFTRFDLSLRVTGFPVRDRWPKIKVAVNRQILWDSEIQGTAEFREHLRIQDPTAEIVITYHGKRPDDTLVDDQGNILQNQHLNIDALCINGVDLVKTQTIYTLGHYHMHLSPEKKRFFLENGHSIEPTHSLDMFENGEWRLSIEMPALSTFIKKKSFYQQHERWIRDDIYQDIFDRIQSIKQLQKQLEEVKNGTK